MPTLSHSVPYLPTPAGSLQPLPTANQRQPPLSLCLLGSPPPTLLLAPSLTLPLSLSLSLSASPLPLRLSSSNFASFSFSLSALSLSSLQNWLEGSRVWGLNSGERKSNRPAKAPGYKEYQLRDYHSWFLKQTLKQYKLAKLSAIEACCCRPPYE
ncbi:hypothetical protein CJ030_MR3G012249 [Morella rubra]|uniref:Uncharacterized protein n=1 Tax=Morella rubra TaxID=262757 RepID=A0A6A1W3H4_9ROSI|nr:hypothetical protein CJ030_MR3G012249 [Morella rubra]